MVMQQAPSFIRPPNAPLKTKMGPPTFARKSQHCCLDVANEINMNKSICYKTVIQDI
jgi:hypothetical protein